MSYKCHGKYQLLKMPNTKQKIRKGGDEHP